MSWSQGILTSLEARDKDGFILGTIDKPDVDELEFKLWGKKNDTMIRL